MEQVYVQTASFSRELRADFNGSLEKIASYGYTGLELFDKIYGGFSAKELRQYLKSLELSVIGAHIYHDSMDEEDMAYLEELSCPYLVCPGLQINSAEEAHRAAELLNSLGRQWKKYGVKYGYHNHTSDYSLYEGQRVIDILIAETDPDLVFFELDAAWSWRSGVNAAEFVKSHPGRFELIHLKETSRVLTPEDDMSLLFKKYNIQRGEDGYPIIPPEAKEDFEARRRINCRMGDGIIRIPELRDAADAQGAKAYIVEREYAYTGDIFTSLEEDLIFLREHL